MRLFAAMSFARSGAGRRLCLSARFRIFAICATLIVSGTAVADTCRESGGNQTCVGNAPVVGDWFYAVNPCGSTPADTFGSGVCRALGGTWMPDASCSGAGAQTEALIPAAVEAGWLAFGACTMHATPGTWGTTIDTSICGYQDPADVTAYSNGIETVSFEAVPATGTGNTGNGCVNTVNHLPPGSATASRRRDVTWACPLIGGCQKYQDNSCSVGNPIKPGTGTKVFTETDFTASSSPLQLTRNYNSQGFYRPTGSATVSPGMLGDYWRTNYDRRLYPISGSSYVAAAVQRPDGSVKYFNSSGAEVQHFNGAATDLLVPISGGGWILFRGDDVVETYNAAGYLIVLWDKTNLQQTLSYDSTNRLSSVTDMHGRSLSFAYTGNIQTYSGGTVTVTAPDGTTFLYTVDTNGNLNSVTYPSAIARQYLYEKSGWPHAVTGIIDENGSRYESIDYDSNGRSTASYLAPNTNNGTIGRNTFTYNADGTTTLVSPLGSSSTLAFTTISGVVNLASATQPCTACNGAQSNSYDSAGYIHSRTDFNGSITNYTYDDARGLETQRVEASGTTSQRTINTTWNANFHAPDQRSVLNASSTTETLTKWKYNTLGQVLARCEVDPTISGATSYTCGSTTNAPTGVRQTAYTYCEQAGVTAGTCPLVGLVLTVDGPRTDVTDITSYTYYQTTDLSGCATLGGACHYLGDLLQVTNALGQSATYISYDKNGRVTRLSDANGTLTDMTYHARGWLLTRTVRANANGSASANDATTTFAYDNVGNVTQITQPDGSYLHYVYDSAHRLTDIYDSAVPGNYLQGNHIQYSLDAAGNRYYEDTKDSSNTLRHRIARQFDQLNRLINLVNSSNMPVMSWINPSDAPPSGVTYTNGYDGNGNPVYSVDGNGEAALQTYDPLNRLAKTIQDHPGHTTATQDTTTQYVYDARDNLRSVTDPDNLTTNYTYDGLNNLTNLASPDTGASSYTYDAAGNRATQTDAKGVVTTYSYDALNRLIGISYPTTSLNVTYRYDEGNSTTGCNSSFPVGRLTTMVDSAGSTIYCYDRRGNVTSRSQQIPTTSGLSAINWAAASNGATATASSSYNASFPPSGTIDGDRKGTNWGNGGGWNDGTAGTFPDWLQINFNAAHTISSVTVYTLQDNYSNPIEPTDTTTFSLYGLTAFDVQVLNGSTWTTVASVSGNNNVKRSVNFAPVTTSAIRIVCNNAVGGFSRIAEVEAQYATNWAAASNGATATASSNYGPSFPASSIINGDRKGTAWGSGGGWADGTPDVFPDWVQINFNAPHTINHVAVYTLQDNYSNPIEPTDTMTFSQFGLTAFDVQVLVGSTWTTVASVTGNTLVKRVVNFRPVATSAIRIVCNNGLTSYSRIIEAEAWNDPMLTTAMTYTLADRMATITYPSGAVVTYSRNALGQISAVTYQASATVSAQTLISSASYLPFGPLNVLTYGNGRTLTKSYDTDYAIDKVVSSDPNGLIVDATVDVLGNIVNASSTVGANPPTQKYLYDPLYRLTTSETGAATPAILEQYTYGKTGDRTSAALNGGTATTYSYTAGTHRLASIGATSRNNDANGNTTQTGSATLTYDDRNRIASAGGATYAYNGKGERVAKTVGGATTTFVYGEGGQLLGEYIPSLQQEYIYLDGTVIGINYGGTLYYIETDHLGTPRTVIQPGATPSADAVLWKWDFFGSAFGTHQPNIPGLNLRFPGQYFDSETGLNYNYFRDYEPGTGRYAESDPNGLKAGLNTYSYAGNSPLSYLDPFGLTIWSGWFREYAMGPGIYQDYHLHSKCRNHMSRVVYVRAVYAAWGKASFYSGDGGDAEFNDYRGDDVFPDDSVFNGKADTNSIGGGFGHYWGCNFTVLGEATSVGCDHYPPNGNSGGAGIGFATSIYGRSWVVERHWEWCDDCHE